MGVSSPLTHQPRARFQDDTRIEGPPKGATRRASGGAATTSTTSAEPSRGCRWRNRGTPGASARSRAVRSSSGRSKSASISSTRRTAIRSAAARRFSGVRSRISPVETRSSSQPRFMAECGRDPMAPACRRPSWAVSPPTGNRRFESISLQRRVRCEPDLRLPSRQGPIRSFEFQPGGTTRISNGFARPT